MVEFKVAAVFADVSFGGAGDMDVRALGPVNPEDSHFGTDGAIAGRGLSWGCVIAPRDSAAVAGSGKHVGRVQAWEGFWNHRGVDGGLNTHPTAVRRLS